MTNSDQHDDVFNDQLEIIRLLDERFRLREDPEQRPDLEITHARACAGASSHPSGQASVVGQAKSEG